METLDVLGEPAAMDALGLALSGKGTYRKLNLDDPDSAGFLFTAMLNSR